MSRFLAVVIMVLAFSVAGFAQRSETNSSSAPITSGPELGTFSSEPRIYSRSVTGKVLRVDVADQYIVVELRNAPAAKYVVGGKVRMTADKKAELDGKRDLSLDDFMPGQTVKIVLSVPDNKLLEVHLKARKK